MKTQVIIEVCMGSNRSPDKMLPPLFQGRGAPNCITVPDRGDAVFANHRCPGTNIQG